MEKEEFDLNCLNIIDEYTKQIAKDQAYENTFNLYSSEGYAFDIPSTIKLAKEMEEEMEKMRKERKKYYDNIKIFDEMIKAGEAFKKSFRVIRWRCL